jgi:hypothetical protein
MARQAIINTSRLKCLRGEISVFINHWRLVAWWKRWIRVDGTTQPTHFSTKMSFSAGSIAVRIAEGRNMKNSFLNGPAHERLLQSDKKVIVGYLGNLLNEGFVALPAQPAEGDAWSSRRASAQNLHQAA